MHNKPFVVAIVSLIGGGCGMGDEASFLDSAVRASDLDSETAKDKDLKAKLERAWEASRRYQAGVEVAEADGYVVSSPCETSDEGTMGIHYVHPDKIKAPIDLDDPPILVFLPTEEGRKLVAIEYFQAVIQDGVPYVAPATDPPRPESLPAKPPEIFGGIAFDGPMAGHNPEMPWHYDQHVWLYARNPAGLFAMWNPALECPATSTDE